LAAKDSLKKQKAAARGPSPFSYCWDYDLIDSGFGQPITRPETLAYLAALAPGLLGLRRSRRNGAERMLVGTHGINHVTYFHQDYVSFRFGLLPGIH
jgi:hypothetical protein